MHEFSICRDLVNAVIEELDNLDPPCQRLRAARIVVGCLHQIVQESLEMAYGVLTRDTPAEGSKLEIRFVPVEVRCVSCGWKGPIKGILFCCFACNGTNVDVIKGRELALESLEVETE